MPGLEPQPATGSAAPAPQVLNDGRAGHETSEPAEDRLTNRVIAGRYEVGERIGYGGMSTVYRALDRSLGRTVAVKVIRYPQESEATRAHLRERFRREAANVARIPPHPNVVQVFDYGTDPELDVDFIVMEFVEGLDVKAALTDGAFGIGDSVRILLGAARGLAAGHRVGIIHRDVKPGNVFLVGGRHFESVRILDFGIAKALAADPDDDLTRLTGVPHTPAYASPEQHAGSHLLNPASDVYQLGLVAYELFTGERAFDVHDRERIRKGEHVLLPERENWLDVPPALRTVVERAVRPYPSDRYPDARAFAEALAEAWGDDRTLFASPAPADTTASIGPAPYLPESRGSEVLSIGDRWRAIPRPVLLTLAVVLSILLLWSVLRGWGGTSAENDAALAPSTMELEEEFAPLYHRAAEWLVETNEATEP